MIAAEIVAEVQRLLKEASLSHRKIARLMGVSRGLVDAVASGKRPCYETTTPSDEDAWEEPAGPPSRCHGCGGMVYMPCRLCHARSLSAEESRRFRILPTIEPLGLELRPEHLARYEQVRRWRREGVGVPCGGNLAAVGG